jgi:phosphoribosylformimino-5-aminoimidazole carboxamide ribotide isomerase
MGAPDRGEHRLQIIGVVDLKGGRAVHARGGARHRYSPVHSAAGWPIESGDARTLAEVYTDVLGISEIYAADLDAILERQPQDDATRSLASLRARLWLDAGVRSVDDARRAIEVGASRVIVALETLPSFDILSAICEAVGSDRVAFSLDLREGKPVLAGAADVHGASSPEKLAELAVRSGARTLIVIDLARVGTGRGLDTGLVATLRSATPNSVLVAGGGVRGWDDLVQAAQAGCNAALVATALHDGRISAAEISEAQKL